MKWFPLEAFQPIFISDSVLSMIRIAPQNRESSLIDGFDEMLITVVEDAENRVDVKNMMVNGVNIQMVQLDKRYLSDLMETRMHRRLIQLVMQGEVLYDDYQYINTFREKFSTHPSKFQERTICIEFSHFLQRYLEAKEFVRNGLLLDAYNSVFHALEHWARLTILEAGEIPETVVWQQVHSIDYSIFKLYEELITSTDPLEKRIELLLLASEFSVISKIEKCSKFLLDTMREDSKSWSISELMAHPNFKGIQINLVLLLNKLVTRSLLQEVCIPTVYGTEKRYRIV
ncbi:nucleotidyltransferase-like protein [Aneurinibacillus sp. Ricciae_BoGa-3]|uniref:nucleotidyltransferase-like protein n=1 Tax=Aneurinibacillus sp. Ricciae_BoGa-3 TaxID=3022697 RepID=UPI002340B4DC|nr:nucleotidyltransferase-like protein [Aneurinibacillus sp. Ricciae_BoGa-3]WCK55360.1 nucleotidyltransferase-like protein [Aneurinibacillus sp. Ricciae_BoGa-3]